MRFGRAQSFAPIIKRLVTFQASSYSITAPNPTGANVNTASGNFTLAIPTGQNLSTPVGITPSATGMTFTPATVTLSGPNASGTFTATPTTSGNKTITETNNGGLIDPASTAFVALGASGGIMLPAAQQGGYAA